MKTPNEAIIFVIYFEFCHKIMFLDNIYKRISIYVNIMNFKTICDSIFKLYLYADNCKMIHYSTDSNHEHELADKVRDSIIDFTDNLAESTFGYYGKPKYNDLTVEQSISMTNDLGKLCQNTVDIADAIRSDFNKNEKLSGIVSLIDDFKKEMSKNVFLATFDKVSNYQMKK